MDYGRQVDVQTPDGADAALRQRGTLHMLNYMLLTVVANGHNCVATATAGYAQGRFQVLHWLLQKLSAKALFRKKGDDLLAVVCKTLLY